MARRKSLPQSACTSVQNGVPIESEQGPDSYFDGINLLILWFGDDLRLLRFTKRAAEIFALKASAVGSRISMLKVPGLTNLAAQVLRTRQMLETEVESQNGHWYSLRIDPDLGADGLSHGVVILFVDIDRSKRAERDLVRLNETFQALFHSAPDAIVAAL